MNFTDRSFAVKMALFCVAIVFFVVLDLVEDVLEGVSLFHFATEFAIITICAITFYSVIKHWLSSRKVQRSLQTKLQSLTKEKDQLKKEMQEHLVGLSQVIERQFGQWQFSPTEREVGMLLLKGFSLKEIAHFRSCAEKTIHSHSQAIYRKSKLHSRAEFSAFFLEDLLPPLPEQNSQWTPQLYKR